MRAVLTALAVVGFATSALADIHPMYHERNKAAAASVAVVDVTSITPALRPDHMGECTIAARVTAVERGDLLAVGQRLALTVDCFTEEAMLPSSGMQWQEVARLEASSTGRVWLNADGSMLSPRYYQILD